MYRSFCGRPNLLLNAGVALGVTLAAIAQAMRWTGPFVTGSLIAAIVVPYVLVSAIPQSWISNLYLPPGVKTWVAAGVSSPEPDGGREQVRPFSWADGLSIVPLTAVIVATFIGMVRSSEYLGNRWGVRDVVVGTFVVATLTGVPNLIAALRLALKGRGAALASEAFNSNTLNLVVGAYLPSLLTELPAPSQEAVLAMAWLIGMTALALALGIRNRGFGRWSGAVLVAAYAGFALLVIL